MPARFSLAVLTALLAFVADRPQADAGFLYFTDRGASTVHRAGFDGSGLTPLFTGDRIPGSDNLRGIAVDPRTGHLYFCDNGSHAIFQASMAGGDTPVAIVEGLDFPADIALDPVNDRIYWCDQSAGLIQRARLDGSDVEVVVETEAPYFLHVDAQRNELWWGDFAAGNILRARLADGKDREPVVTGITGRVRGVEPDPDSGYVYWVNRDGDPDTVEDAKIQRRRIEGGDIEDIYTGLDTPHGMVLDRAAGKIYWADTGTNAGSGTGGSTVSRGDMDGSGLPEVIYTGNQPWDVVIDPTPSDYTNWTGRFFRRDASPSTTSFASDPDGDGRPNLLEFGLGIDPRGPDEPARLPRLALDSSQLRGLRFARLASQGHGLDYRVEASEDMRAWSDAGIGVIEPPVPAGSGLESVVLGRSPSAGPSSRLFYRLRVRLQEPQ